MSLANKYPCILVSLCVCVCARARARVRASARACVCVCTCVRVRAKSMHVCMRYAREYVKWCNEGMCVCVGGCSRNLSSHIH